MKRSWMGMTVFLAVTLVSSTLWAQANAPSPETAGRALKQAFEKLNLGPDEKAIFDSEVLSAPAPFITNYQSSDQGLDVQVDSEKLRKFLLFSSNLVSGSSALQTETCVYVRALRGCRACEGIRAEVQEAFESRLRKRGFGVKAGASIALDSSSQGESAFEEYAAKVLPQGLCSQLLFAELSLQRTADEGEDDEVQVQNQAFFQVKTSQGRKAKSRSTAVVRSPSDFTEKRHVATELATLAVTRLSADLFAQLASQLVVSNATKIARNERYLRLENVHSFSDYLTFKQAVTTQLPDLKIEERFIQPGAFEFAVGSEWTLPELGKRLKTLSWGSRKLEVLRSGPEELAVALR